MAGTLLWHDLPQAASFFFYASFARFDRYLHYSSPPKPLASHFRQPGPDLPRKIQLLDVSLPHVRGVDPAGRVLAQRTARMEAFCPLSAHNLYRHRHHSIADVAPARKAHAGVEKVF